MVFVPISLIGFATAALLGSHSVDNVVKEGKLNPVNLVRLGVIVLSVIGLVGVSTPPVVLMEEESEAEYFFECLRQVLFFTKYEETPRLLLEEATQLFELFQQAELLDVSDPLLLTSLDEHEEMHELIVALVSFMGFIRRLPFSGLPKFIAGVDSVQSNTILYNSVNWLEGLRSGSRSQKTSDELEAAAKTQSDNTSSFIHVRKRKIDELYPVATFSVYPRDKVERQESLLFELGLSLTNPPLPSIWSKIRPCIPSVLRRVLPIDRKVIKIVYVNNFLPNEMTEFNSPFKEAFQSNEIRPPLKTGDYEKLKQLRVKFQNSAFQLLKKEGNKMMDQPLDQFTMENKIKFLRWNQSTLQFLVFSENKSYKKELMMQVEKLKAQGKYTEIHQNKLGTLEPVNIFELGDPRCQYLKCRKMENLELLGALAKEINKDTGLGFTRLKGVSPLEIFSLKTAKILTLTMRKLRLVIKIIEKKP